MDPDELFTEVDTVMQAAQEVFDARHKFERNEPIEMPMALKATTRIDPTMLLAKDAFSANCKDCGKAVEMCVCSDIDDALLDTLIQQVSVPNLAALYQKAATRIDPTMLLAKDAFSANCKDCGKAVEMCVCSDIDDALLDTLIQQVSVPTLAAWYQKAQDQGLVEPMYHYQSNS